MKNITSKHAEKQAVADPVDELRRLRGSFGLDARQKKARLLRSVLTARITRGVQVLGLHNELLFIAAFPDNKALRDLAGKALSEFHRRVARLGARERAVLGDNGIAGTTVVHTFLYHTVLWLLEQQQRVTIDWKQTEDPERLDLLLRQTLVPVEAEAFESDAQSTEDWVALAGGGRDNSILQWLLGSVTGNAATLWRDLYDDASLALSWELGDTRWSASRNRAPVARIALREAFRAPPTDLPAHVTRPLPDLRPLSRAKAKWWRDASIAALATRAREVLPTISANLDEIYVIPLGKGVDLCVLGVSVEHRLPLEANYGYVMFSNGIPVGYGGVTALADQANTGINVFESFRHSEAAFLFAESLRAFHALFGVSRFIVNPYQLGADNDEALESGSYWFYHRLGFRSRDPEIRALADTESARNARWPRRRSSLSVLRRLASADVVLKLPASHGTIMFEERWLCVLGRAVAKHLSQIPLGCRDAHLSQLARDVCAALTGMRRPLQPAERAGARHLLPVIALLRDEISCWPLPERSALWELVRLKGERQERAFAQASRGHAVWWSALAALCERLARKA